MRRSTLFPLAVAGLLALAFPLEARLPFVKKAQEQGFKDIKSCTACHRDAMPKAASQGEPYQEMGTFLKEQKAKRKAAEVDLGWLKDFKPAAK